jgi:hypothetical protein
MPRRLALSFSLVLALVLAAATLALASGGGDDAGRSSATGATSTATTTGTTAAPATPAQRVGHRGHGRRGHHGGAMFKMAQRVVLGSLAERLAVKPKALEDAVHDVAEEQFTKKAAEAGLTAAQTSALKACHTARHSAKARAATRRVATRRGSRRGARAAGCDRATVKAAVKRLKALPPPDLAALKTELSGSLATKLGVTAEKVLEATRAELDQRLGQGVALGFVTTAGRTQVLACFDTPATCDIKALRKQLRGHHGKPGRAHQR